MASSSARGTVIAYWVTTLISALLFVVPGTALIFAVPHFTQDMAQLGYPPYFLTILGIAKILGVFVILMPRLARLKEWAYAGMVIDTVCGAISRAVVGGSTIKIVIPLLVTGIVLLSWRLRPEGRTLVQH